MLSNDYHRTAARYAQRPQNVGTDSLVFRALEVRLRELCLRGDALDVGCGTGRSTRFLQGFGLRTVGLDISEAMLKEARRIDSSSEYHSYVDGTRFPFENDRFSLILSTWAVLELGTLESLRHFIKESSRVLNPDGTVFIATNTPEFYSRRWVSCDVNFPENNAPLQSGQQVTALLLPEGVQVRDYFWTDLDYRSAFADAGLIVKDAFYPTASANEEGWYDETKIAPHVIYELVKRRGSRLRG
ncbi:MAG: class I SAM-dependent methyltransferase [Candidatus Binatia bacterium]